MRQDKAIEERELFFKQWLRSPRSMGSFIPSSRALARAMAEETVWRPGSFVVELGGGTGAITRGLLEGGIPPDHLLVVELDRSLYEYLRETFRDCRVVQGDATRLDEILKRQGIEQVSTVVSGLPLLNMSKACKRRIIEQALRAVGTDGFVVQYTYSPLCPIPAREFGVDARIARYVLWNFPPAAVWRFSRSRDGSVA